MEGLAINFSADGATLSTTDKVEHFATIAQNGMVNIGTIHGSDPINTNRGTDIYNSGVLGKLTTYRAAYHATNFAAIDTEFYLRETDVDDPTYERVDSVTLEPKSYTNNVFTVNAFFTGENGSTVGKSIFIT